MIPKGLFSQPDMFGGGGSLVSGVEDLVAGIGRKTVGNILHRQEKIGTKERRNQNRIKRSVEKAAKKAELMM